MRPECNGIGKTLLSHLAGLALERDCARLELAVVHWIELAIGFYRSLGARLLTDWRIFRFDGEALTRLASGRRG